MTVLLVVLEPICCPSCNSDEVVKNGQSNKGNSAIAAATMPSSRFILNYSDSGYLPEVKQQVSDMAMNGRGICDTARVLKISPTTVIETLKESASSDAG